MLNFSTAYNPFAGPLSQTLQQDPSPVPTFANWNPFEEAAPNPFQTSKSPTAQFDTIPSTFSSTKSINVYNPDPTVQTKSPASAFDSQSGANPFVSNGTHSNPFTKPNQFDPTKSSKASPGDFTRDELSDAKLSQSKNKGYETL
jgi:hypothetical protein